MGVSRGTLVSVVVRNGEVPDPPHGREEREMSKSLANPSNRPLTVGELVAFLSKLHPSLPVGTRLTRSGSAVSALVAVSEVEAFELGCGDPDPSDAFAAVVIEFGDDAFEVV